MNMNKISIGKNKKNINLIIEEKYNFFKKSNTFKSKNKNKNIHKYKKINTNITNDNSNSNSKSKNKNKIEIKKLKIYINIIALFYNLLAFHFYYISLE